MKVDSFDHPEADMLELSRYAALDCIDLVKAVAHKDQRPEDLRDAAFAALRAIQDWRATYDIYSSHPMNTKKGVLSGVPILHKDGGAQIEGYPCEYGSPLGRGVLGTRTSHFFRVLLEHGCQIVGRSRVPELHMSVLADNAALGSTVNPWAPDHSMGGSTGGVTALSLGAVPVVHGGDSGGSLRVPAAWAGCYSLKPSSGTVSSSPGGTELLGLNEIFVATRSLRDIRLFFQILSVAAHDDSRVPATQYENLTHRRATIGICRTFYPGLPVDPYMLSGAERLAADAERLGFNVIDLPLSFDFDEVCEVLWVVGSLDLRIMVENLAGVDRQDSLADHCQPYVARWYDDSAEISGPQVVSTVDAAGRLGRKFASIFSRCDYLVTPVTAFGPPPLGSVHPLGVSDGSRALNRKFEEIVHFCAIANMSGHPALVIPYAEMPTSAPCGVQIIGRRGDDLGVCDLACLFDKGFQPPPGSLIMS